MLHIHSNWIGFQIQLWNEENAFIIFRMSEDTEEFKDCMEFMTLSDLCKFMTGVKDILNGGMFLQEDRTKFMTPIDHDDQHVAIFGVIQDEMSADRILEFTKEMNAVLTLSSENAVTSTRPMRSTRDCVRPTTLGWSQGSSGKSAGSSGHSEISIRSPNDYVMIKWKSCVYHVYIKRNTRPMITKQKSLVM